MKIIHGPNDLSTLKTDIGQTALLDFLTDNNINKFYKLINIIGRGISEDITDLLDDMYIPYTTNLNEYGICKYYNDDTNLYNNEEILQCIKALTIINYNYTRKFNGNGGEFNTLNYTTNEKPLLKHHTLSFWNNGNLTVIENVIGRWDNIYRDHSIYFIITEDSHIYYVLKNVYIKNSIRIFLKEIKIRQI